MCATVAQEQIIPVEVVLLGVVHGLEPLLGRLDIHSFASHDCVCFPVRLKRAKSNDCPTKEAHNTDQQL
jgi:hypothetical protein